MIPQIYEVQNMHNNKAINILYQGNFILDTEAVCNAWCSDGIHKYRIAKYNLIACYVSLVTFHIHSFSQLCVCHSNLHVKDIPFQRCFIWMCHFCLHLVKVSIVAFLLLLKKCII